MERPPPHSQDSGAVLKNLVWSSSSLRGEQVQGQKSLSSYLQSAPLLAGRPVVGKNEKEEEGYKQWIYSSRHLFQVLHCFVTTFLNSPTHQRPLSTTLATVFRALPVRMSSVLPGFSNENFCLTVRWKSSKDGLESLDRWYERCHCRSLKHAAGFLSHGTQYCTSKVEKDHVTTV